MKVRFVSILLSLCVLVLGTQKLSAQSPDQQFGFGFNVGSEISGGHIAYAISPSFHLGGLVGLNMISSSGSSVNGFVLAPYGKFLLKGSKNFVPFIMGQFVLLNGDLYKRGNDTPSFLNASFGGEYFASKNDGVFGSINLVQLGFSPSVTTIGITTQATVGIEWFMD